jgi:3'(2'), 5'-bisphosphate nucleotidase
VNEPIATDDLLDALCDVARRAGAAIMNVYGSDVAVELKDDRSPLTAADRAAHDVICDALASLEPRWPLLSEESPADEVAARRSWPRFWLVDPLDGTKEFLKRNGEFTVNIALVDGHRAVLGVVFAPALDLLYFGAAGRGAARAVGSAPPVPIRVRVPPADPLRVVGSRSHASGELGAFLQRLGPYELKPMGSSLKICLVAAGDADVYPRFGPTSEWDTAAAQAILEAAGGRMIDLAGQSLRYNLRATLLNPFFLAVGDHRRNWLASRETQ